MQLYFFERKIEKTQTNLQTLPTQAKSHWNGVVQKKLDVSMILPEPKKKGRRVVFWATAYYNKKNEPPSNSTQTVVGWIGQG